MSVRAITASIRQKEKREKEREMVNWLKTFPAPPNPTFQSNRFLAQHPPYIEFSATKILFLRLRIRTSPVPHTENPSLVSTTFATASLVFFALQRVSSFVVACSRTLLAPKTRNFLHCKTLFDACTLTQCLINNRISIHRESNLFYTKNVKLYIFLKLISVEYTLNMH